MRSKVTNRSEAAGNRRRNAANSCGKSVAASASVPARVKRRVVVSGSKRGAPRIPRAPSSHRRSSGASVLARGVGVRPRAVRTKSGSSKVSRSRRSALDTADWVTWRRLAASVALEVSSTASSTTSRFRSTDARFTALMGPIMTHHWW